LLGCRRSFRRRSQNAPGEKVLPERVTITMPVHPLLGIELELVRTCRDHLARRDMLIAEVPGGRRLVLPVEWTDRGAPWVTPTVDGREVRLSARGLLALACAVDAACRDGAGASAPASSVLAEAPQPSEDPHVSSRKRTPDVDGTDARDAARSAGRVGKPDAQDAPAKRGRR
jgi:hypothetical protein